jgi:hypothetical protein
MSTEGDLTPTGEYWIVNHILAKGLHNTDGECLQYTTTLMDKLEQVFPTSHPHISSTDAELTLPTRLKLVIQQMMQ